MLALVENHLHNLKLHYVNIIDECFQIHSERTGNLLATGILRVAGIYFVELSSSRTSSKMVAGHFKVLLSFKGMLR